MPSGKNQVSEDPWRNEQKHLTCENGKLTQNGAFEDGSIFILLREIVLYCKLA